MKHGLWVIKQNLKPVIAMEKAEVFREPEKHVSQGQVDCFLSMNSIHIFLSWSFGIMTWKYVIEKTWTLTQW